MRRIFLLFLVFAVFLCSCDDIKSPSIDSGSQNDSDASSVYADVSFAQTDEEMFTDRDGRTEYDENTAVKIFLKGDSIECASSAVKIDGTAVTITEEKTYIISGTLDDGMIIVDADDTAKLQIVLSGASVNSNTCAPLYVLEADKVFITLADGTENSLSNGGEFVSIDDNNIDAAVFSKQDITFNGTGALSVSSPAGHGIVSKDDLVFTGGSYKITCASHAVDANDSIRVSGSGFNIDAGKDGIHAENGDDESLGFVYISNGTFNIEAEGDGISAGSYIQISDGNFDIVTGGGSVNASRPSSDGWGQPGGKPEGGPAGGRPGGRSSAAETATDEASTSIKGIKASGSVLISGGVYNLDTADDSVHANVSVTVNGGTFNISAGDDAFHADETLAITHGIINISDSYEGLEALNVTVSGGDIRIVASDDGINAAGGNDSSGMGGMRPGGDKFGGNVSSNGSVLISGGTVYMNASGDGIDSNGTLTITGGYVTVCGPTRGDTAVLDYDKSAVITGGIFVGTGASKMAQTITSSGQGVIALSVGNRTAGTKITITDSNGKEIISYEPALSFEIVIISTPEIIKGHKYSVTVGSLSADFEAE